MFVMISCLVVGAYLALIDVTLVSHKVPVLGHRMMAFSQTWQDYS